MNFNDNFQVAPTRKRPNMLQKMYLWCKFYGYWYFAGAVSTAYTVAKMAITFEKRLYYMYSTNEVVTITAFNYIQRVKVDNKEYALIKTVTASGFSYTKGERF